MFPLKNLACKGLRKWFNIVIRIIYVITEKVPFAVIELKTSFSELT